jgi:hypothetical protein
MDLTTDCIVLSRMMTKHEQLNGSKHNYWVCYSKLTLMSPVPGKNKSPYLWKLAVITLKNIKEKQLRNLKALHHHATKSIVFKAS